MVIRPHFFRTLCCPSGTKVLDLSSACWCVMCVSPAQRYIAHTEFVGYKATEYHRSSAYLDLPVSCQESLWTREISESGRPGRPRFGVGRGPWRHHQQLCEQQHGILWPTALARDHARSKNVEDPGHTYGKPMACYAILGSCRFST